MRSLVFVVSLLFPVYLSAADIELRQTPCRLYDSRIAGTGSKINSTTIETFKGRVSTASQGAESGCGIKETSIGAVVNLIVFQPESGGWARVWAKDKTEPLSTSINSSPGILNESTGLMTMIGTNGQLSLNSSITLAHYIVDLTGEIDGAGESLERGNPSHTTGPRLRRVLTFINAPFAALPGDRAIVSPTGAVGPFVGHENEFVYWDGASWIFEVPVYGDIAYESSTDKYWKYNAVLASWSEI